MKLYSKNQVLIFSVCALVLGAVLSFCVFSFSANGKNNQKNEQIVEKSVSNEEKIVSDEENVNKLVNLKKEDNKEEFFAQNVKNESYSVEELQNISVYESCNEAVVNINTQVVGVNWFLEPVVEDGGSGSGSIIDKRGYVLTNVHVVNNAAKIYVSLSDGTQFEAKVVGLDKDSDLAVIKFDPPSGVELKTISFGDSSSLKVGQRVIAIGNPYGLDRTMTTGIISALGRPIKNSNDRIIRNMIQTDSAINPGNSGGPLLTTSGKMIGINTMIYSSSGSSAGIGFAVPSETAIRVSNDLINYGKVRRGVMALQVVQLTNRIALYANLDISRGLLVSTVTKGKNADFAGLKAGTTPVRYGNSIIYLGGDIITKIDGVSIPSIADYYSVMENKRPGDEITVTVHRNKKDIELKVTLSEN